MCICIYIHTGIHLYIYVCLCVYSRVMSNLQDLAQKSIEFGCLRYHALTCAHPTHPKTTYNTSFIHIYIETCHIYRCINVRARVYTYASCHICQTFRKKEMIKITEYICMYVCIHTSIYICIYIHVYYVARPFAKKQRVRAEATSSCGCDTMP